MRFGAFLPSFWADYGASSVGVAVAEAARSAADLGYEGVWVNDVVIMPAADRKPGDTTRALEPLVTLASLVHLAPRVTLGTAVLVLPQRHPVLVAKQTADLHLLSGGRLILGVGIGHRPGEFALLGADYADRAAATDEAIEILRTLWREPVADYQARFHRLESANMEPRPPGAGPPIWIGGSSRAAIQRAARYGDGWLPFVLDVAGVRAGAAALRELTQGRPCPTVANVVYLRIVRPDEPAALRSTTSRMRKAFAGGVDAVAEHLEEYRRAGLEYAVCFFESEDVDDLLRQMRTFAERIAPRLTDGA
jgi:probable F420-dependent oxidoreductase